MTILAYLVHQQVSVQAELLEEVQGAHSLECSEARFGTTIYADEVAELGAAVSLGLAALQEVLHHWDQIIFCFQWPPSVQSRVRLVMVMKELSVISEESEGLIPRT